MYMTFPDKDNVSPIFSMSIVCTAPLFPVIWPCLVILFLMTMMTDNGDHDDDSVMMPAQQH